MFTYNINKMELTGIKPSDEEPKGPDDKVFKDLIDNMATKVAKYGITYEDLVRKIVQDMKDTQGSQPHDISFFEEGKPFNDYYRHEVHSYIDIIFSF